MRLLKRVVVALVAVVVVFAASIWTRHYFRVVRHQHRVEDFEDVLYEDAFVDLGGGTPVTVWHGLWRALGVGDYSENCLGISRQSDYSLADPIGTGELAIQAQRLSVYLEDEGWSVKRLSHVDADQEVLPASMRVHRVFAVRDTEFANIDFLQDLATMRGGTNNCGKPSELPPNQSETMVIVESFGN